MRRVLVGIPMGSDVVERCYNFRGGNARQQVSLWAAYQRKQSLTSCHILAGSRQIARFAQLASRRPPPRLLTCSPILRSGVCNAALASETAPPWMESAPPITRMHWPEQPTQVAPPHSSLPPPLLSVAPMMEWTDNHFRFLARLLTHRAHLYTEMVVDNTLRHNRDDLARFLEFPLGQHPLVLQLGGSNPEHLADAARMAATFGYDELNLNCGCPSEKVAGHGCFGAILMLSPELVGDAAAAMEAASGLPVTIKCRIGVDDRDSYEELCT
eukprot:jgi/Mesvir1/16445/Mv17247-RA.1